MLRRNPLRFIKKLRSLDRSDVDFAARAWMLAPVVEASLATVGLKRTLSWCTWKPRRVAAAPSLDRARWLVDAVYGVHFVRGTCLPRALVQYALLRRTGVQVSFVIGVDKRRGGPLDAHAWVENGEPGPSNGQYAPLLVTA